MFKEYGEMAATLYELTKPAGHSVDGDIEYYCGRLAGVKGKILEAGVGTGRMLVPLLQQGFDVDGVDISRPMLQRCEANLAKHGLTAKLYRQDLTELELPEKYAAIIMPTGSFCLLPKKLVRDVLKSFLKQLEGGGKIIIDLIFPQDFKRGEVVAQTYPLSSDNGILYTNISRDINWVEQKTSQIIKYEMVKSGEVVCTEVSDFTLFWYGVEEFVMLLQQAGFAEIDYEFGYGMDKDLGLVTFTAFGP